LPESCQVPASPVGCGSGDGEPTGEDSAGDKPAGEEPTGEDKP
jgi:hypothetical protein